MNTPQPAKRPRDPDEPLLVIEDLEITFRGREQDVAAVRGIDLTLEAGATLALVGESGSGKSSTALAVLRLNPEPPVHYRGSVRLDGTELLEAPPAVLRRIRGHEAAMIFQDPMATLDPMQTIGRQIGEVLGIHGAPRSERRERVLAALDQARIPHPELVAAQYPHQLSGGLRQRAMIAMALVERPRLLIADEPTTALDVTVQAEILDLLRTVQEETGMALLLITHDLGVVASIADRVAVMQDGRIVETGSALDVLGSPQDPYTQRLLAATPTLSRGGAR